MLDAAQLLFLIVFFLSNTIMTVTGFAGTMLAMPVSILLLGAENARFILNVTAILSCVFIAVQQWRYANKKELKKILLVMLLGMAIGTVLYRIVPLPFLLPVYGAVIVAIALKRLFLPETTAMPRWLCLLVLLAGGVIHGMFVSGGALLVLYATMVLKDKAEFRATIAATWAVLDPTFFILNFQTSLWNRENLLLIALCMVPLFLSVYVGNLLHNRINKKLFMRLTYVLLLASGLSILI